VDNPAPPCRRGDGNRIKASVTACPVDHPPHAKKAGMDWLTGIVAIFWFVRVRSI